MKSVPVFIVALFLMFPMYAAANKVGGGDITFRPVNADPVVFSHEKHVNDKGLKCTGCHYAIFQMAHGSYKMNMEQINKGGFCGKCHNGHKSFDVHEKKNCVRCHKQRSS